MNTFGKVPCGPRAALLAAGLAVFTSTVSADPVYWCGLESSDSWLSTCWSLTTTPQSDADLVDFPSGGDAVIGEISDATKTIPVDGAATVGSIAFRSDGNEVSGTGPITFTGGEINCAAGTTNTVGVPLTGTVPYVKTGAGALFLTGTNTTLKPASPLVVREGLLKLAKKNAYSIGCYGTSSVLLPLTVESGATLDLNGCFWDVSPYCVNATIAGTGFDGKGALIDTGMVGQFNKYLSQVTLADDALVRADGQLYVSKVVANGHTLTKIGGTQFCLSSFEGAGNLRVKQGDFTAFGTGALPGSGTIYMSGGRVAFWEGNETCSRPIVVEDNSSIHISGGSNVSRKMAWTGPIDVPAGKTLSFTASYSLHEWTLKSDPTGSGTIGLRATTNAITTPTLAFPGTIYNTGILNVGSRGSATGGTLGPAGWIRNDNRLVPLGTEMSFGRSVSGSGTMDIAASNQVTLTDAVFTNALNVACGDLTFDNVKGTILSCLYVGQANTAPFFSLTNVSASFTIKGASDLWTPCVQTGNGDLNKFGNAWPITGIVNQVSGNLHVTGCAGDDDALHLGHWPMGRATYNMMGGTLTVENRKYKIAVAVDGRGIFNLSGGDVYTAEFCINGRNGDGGHGTLNMTGGTLHLGARGMTVGTNCTTYVANLGGGTIRGWEGDTLIDVKASLTGTGASAVTFDTAEGDILVRRALTGTGDFNKVGTGVLLITNACTYAGTGYIREGTARFDGAGSVTGTIAAVSAGVVDLNGLAMTHGTFAGTGVVSNGVIGAGAVVEGGLAGVGTNTLCGVTFAAGGALGVTVAAEGCGRVDVGAASVLDGVKIVVTNPAALDPHRTYAFARCADGLAARFDQSALPDGWHVAKNGDQFVLDGNNGTLVLFR